MKRSPDGPVRQRLKAFFRHPKNVRILICKLRTNETGESLEAPWEKIDNRRTHHQSYWLVTSSMQLMSQISFGRVAAILQLQKNIFPTNLRGMA